MLAALLCGGTTANKAAGQETLGSSPTGTSGVAANTLTTTPASEPFGSVPMGTTKSHTVELKNTGHGERDDFECNGKREGVCAAWDHDAIGAGGGQDGEYHVELCADGVGVCGRQHLDCEQRSE